MTYHVTNTSATSKSYVATNGNRISFEPGETKKLATLPPEASENDLEVAGWSIEKAEQNADEEKAANTNTEGGDN